MPDSERLAGDLRDILREAGTTALLVTHDHEEAFAVADRIAVMRAGQIIQQGDLNEVWRAPADAGDRALPRLRPGRRGGRPRRGCRPVPRPVALRRSALPVVDGRVPGGQVVSARATPEQVRLVVDVGGIGVWTPCTVDQRPAVGALVRLAADHTRMAVHPGAVRHAAP